MKKRAFTLIELLVVIAIIVLLVSILVPSLKQAKELAQKMKCATSLKNIGQSSNMFAADNEDRFPGGGQFGSNTRSGGSSCTWQNVLNIFFFEGRDVVQRLITNGPNEDALVCPSVLPLKYARAYGMNPRACSEDYGKTILDTSEGISTTINLPSTGNSTWNVWKKYYLGARLDFFGAETYLVGELECGSDGFSSTWTYRDLDYVPIYADQETPQNSRLWLSQNGGRYSFRHPGYSANVLHGGGYVTSVTSNDPVAQSSNFIPPN